MFISIEYLKKFSKALRKYINGLLFSKLSDVLSDRLQHRLFCNAKRVLISSKGRHDIIKKYVFQYATRV